MNKGTLPALGKGVSADNANGFEYRSTPSGQKRVTYFDVTPNQTNQRPDHV